MKTLLHFSDQLTLPSTTVPNLLHSPETLDALPSTDVIRFKSFFYDSKYLTRQTLPFLLASRDTEAFSFHYITQGNSTPCVLYSLFPHLLMNLICNLSSLTPVYLVSLYWVPSHGCLNKLLSLSHTKKNPLACTLLSLWLFSLSLHNLISQDKAVLTSHLTFNTLQSGFCCHYGGSSCDGHHQYP